MNKKLINWAQCPKGVMTNHGELLGVDTINKDIASLYIGSYPLPFRHINFAELRLAPADQQPWLVYENGVTVVPEWAVCEYRGFAYYCDSDGDTGIDFTTIKEDKRYIDYVCHYRIIGVKEGWTDNPNEVTK